MTITRQQLVSILVELPAKLHEAEAELWRTEHEKIKIAKQMSIRKAQLAIEIAMEKDQNGKSRYSSQETREHALELRLAEDEAYQQFADEYEKACVREEQARCELSYQRYRLKVAELLTQLLTAGEDQNEDRVVSSHRGELRRGDRSEDRQAHWTEARRSGSGRAVSGL
jgi:hypothetical protein